MKKVLILVLMALSMEAGAQTLNLENIWNSREFYAKSVPGFNSMKDGKSYCILENGQDQSRSCVRYDISNGNRLGVLFTTSKMLIDSTPVSIESYAFSEDETKVLITNGFESVYRHSGKSNVYVYDMKTSKLRRISNRKLMYPQFSPDGNKVAYVLDNNLYYFDLEKNKDVQITRDGEKNSIINGAVDWVYEEEFSMSQGYQWSPESDFIAYYKFDESKVPGFGMDIYGSLYPKREEWKYPKAGEPNSRVDVYIHKIGKKKDVLCQTGSENDQYLPRIKWISRNFLSVQRLNRHQNKLEVLRFSYFHDQPETMYTEENQRYIDIDDWAFFNTTSAEWYALFTSEKSGYKHIYRMDANLKVTPVTSGDWEVESFLGEFNGLVYFTSGKENPTERQLYSIDLKTGNLTKLSSEKGWHGVGATDNFEYFIDNYSTMASPPVTVIRDRSGSVIRTIEDNTVLKGKLEGLNLGKVDFGSFTTSEGVKLDYWQILPPDFNPEKKYPVLFYVYGGPGHQTVKNQWQGANYLWYQYMASKGYIVISVDNRGSGGRGEEFKKMTYLQLGKYETIDYMEAARYFGNQPYVDSKRIGVFGWSYGGFMASNCITKGADLFKTAVAVAPVTNWRYYDNIYTERYMRTPAENAAGYDENSPLSHVSKIKGHYLIIHGTADDNVHFQNAAEMVMAMNAQNIRYDAAYYPNTNHGIRGGKIRLHLFTKITDYLLENL